MIKMYKTKEKLGLQLFEITKCVLSVFMMIGGNYWYAGLSVCRKLFNHHPCTVPID